MIRCQIESERQCRALSVPRQLIILSQSRPLQSRGRASKPIQIYTRLVIFSIFIIPPSQIFDNQTINEKDNLSYSRTRSKTFMPKFQWTAGRVGARLALTCLRSQLLSLTIRSTRRGFRLFIRRNQVRSRTMTRCLYQLPPAHTKWGPSPTQDPIRLCMTPSPGKDMVNRQAMLERQHLIVSRTWRGCYHSSQARGGRVARRVILGQTLLKGAQNVTEIGQAVGRGVEQIILITAPTDVQSQEVNRGALVVKLTGPL